MGARPDLLAPIRSTFEVRATQAIPSATTDAAIGNWDHTTDRNWHGYIDFIYLWNRVLDIGARQGIQKNRPRL
jgi:hypothetical protein